MQKLFQTSRLVAQRVQFFNAKSVIKTVEGHRCPGNADSVPGRYASVLFTGSSQAENLDKVNEDMLNLKKTIESSQKFEEFLANVSFKRAQQTQVMKSIQDTLTNNSQQLISNQFKSDTLIENKRLDELPKVADKFIEYYKILNKEENIRIISATPLSQADQKRVSEALKKANQGVNFTIRYEEDPTILGGLQMYSGDKFMDCSLFSRLQKVKGELQRLSF